MTSPQTDTTTTAGEPEPIKAVPLRRPGQWIAAVIILVLAGGLFVYGAATNKAYAWGTYADYLFDQRVLSGVGYTLALTVLAMTIAIVLGVALAIMRLSPNPVLRGTAWVYLWIFRGTPVYVQLVFWGTVPGDLQADRRRHPIRPPVRVLRHPNPQCRIPVRGHRPRAQRGRLHGRDRARRRVVGR